MNRSNSLPVRWTLHKVNTLPWLKTRSKPIPHSSSATFDQDHTIKNSHNNPVSIINIDHHNRNYETGRATYHGTHHAPRTKETKESLIHSGLLNELENFPLIM